MTTKKPAGLKFSPTQHRYWLDGKPVPGVTTILGVLDKSGPLTKWAAGMVAEYVADNPDGVEHLRAMGRGPMVAALKGVPWEKLDKAAGRGTAFHAYAETIAKGGEADVQDDLVGHVESAVAFMDEWRVHPILTEAACASREHRHAGTLDLVAQYTHPQTGEQGVGIFDWKSGKRIYATCAFQLNAYGHSEFHGMGGDEHPMGDLGITAAFGIHIRADGYDAYPLPYGPDIYGEFLTIRRAFDINKRAQGDWRTPGSGYVGLAVQHGLVA